MTDFTDKTFRETYRDYYNAEDGYYRVMFKSGRALQARELIESQTIIQEEIARFGQNIFKEGSMVNPGGATVDNKLEYIRLDPSSTFDASLVGQILTNGVVEFQILEMYDAVNDDPATLYVKYTDTSAFTDNTKAPRVASKNVLSRVDAVAINMTVINDDEDPIPASGRATKAHFAAGDFFVQGHFVYLEEGSSFISKYSATPTDDIGFKVQQQIITEGEDEKLYDNQGQVPDHTAPGAHRYQIKLIPTTRELFKAESETEEAEGNFVFIARVVNGVITREVTTFDAYNRINDLMAQRTKEESGNYVVEKFTAIFEDKDEENLNLDVSEGIAYVDGYRLDIGATDITVPKARDTLEKFNEPVPATFGNYVYIEEGASGSQGFGRLATFGHQKLKTSPNGETIGFCNVRAVQRDGIGVRLYIFDIRMDAIPAAQGGGYRSFSEATILEDPTPGLGEPQIVMVDSVIHEASDNSLLFELPRTTPTKDSINVNYTAQVTTTTQADGSGELTLSGVEQTQWIIAEENGDILPNTPDMTGKYSGLTPGQTYTIAYYVEKTNITPRSKTITESVEYHTVTVSDQQGRPLLLDYADGIKLKSVKYRPSTETGPWDDAADITHQFTLDGGQRDNFYDRSVAYLKAGYLIPYDGVAKDVQVVYDYYAHEDKEGYFCAASYVDDAYEDIPKHTLSSGQVVCLRDVLDFRPTKQFSGSYLREFIVKAPLPQNASAISIDDIEYYLPRIDILVANAVNSRDGVGFGELQVIQGQSAVTPREPEIPTGSMAMYKFRLNAYTFDRSDLSSVYIPNKRFTMKDIGELEKRIDNLYEMTTLNMLENNTVTLPVPDATGVERIKTGFIADNFSSYIYSDIKNPNYRASRDQIGQSKPSFRENSVRLSYSTDNVDAIVKNGDVVTLPFVSTELMSQNLATDIINVNPFAVVSQVGTLELSPSSDEWIETRDLPPQMQTIERTNTGHIQDQYGDDLWDYGGGTSGILGYTSTSYVSGLDATVNLTLFDYTGTQVAGEEVTPYMRSRRINFVAKGLRPNTKMFAFFGEKDVSSWVRQEATTQRFADNPQEFGSQYASATEYPADLGGPTTLQTDGSGKLIGSFFLPNTDTIKFRSGKQVFKLLDISDNNENESTVSARASYSSTGSVDSVQQSIQTTRVVEKGVGRRDPLAQTFFVDQIENPNGLFLTKARIYLESKDTTTPLEVQIRAVESGVPSNRIVPGSVKFIEPSDITVTPFDSDTTIADVQTNPTVVEFDEPIYLTSGQEYAIVLSSESVNYNIYIAETYNFVIGSREDKVTRQAAAGLLFLSQNGSTWSPDQSKDLMFELERAEFNTSGALVLDNAPLPKVSLGTDPLETTSGSVSVKVYHEGHGFSLGDNVAISGVANAIGGVAASEFNGTFDIKSVNWDGYTIEVVTAAPMSGIGGGDTVVASQQVYYDSFKPQIQSVIPNKTGITAKLFDAKAKSYGGNSASDSRKLGQFSYSLPSSLANARQVFLNDYNTNSQPSIVASSENASGAETMKFNLQLTTSDPKVSPVIDLQRVSVLALENIIDKNVDLDSKYKVDDQGNLIGIEPFYQDFEYAVQHITTAVTVNDSSRAIKVLFSGNRPPGSDFEVYVKVAADEDALTTNAEWVRLEIDKPLPSDENPSTFRDYEYTADVDQFTAFKVKVVMHSNNSSRSPTIRDLRAIALVTPYGGTDGGGTDTSGGGTDTSGGTGTDGGGTDTSGGGTDTSGGGTDTSGGGTDTGDTATAFSDVTSLPATLNITGSPRTLGGYNPEQDRNQYGEPWRYWHAEGRILRLFVRYQPSGDFQVITSTGRTAESTVGADYLDQFTVLATGKWLDRPVLNGETFEVGTKIFEIDGQSVPFRSLSTSEDPHPSLRNVGTGADLGPNPVVSVTVEHDSTWAGHGYSIAEHSTWVENGKPYTWDSLHLDPAQDITGSFKMNLFVRGDNITDVEIPVEVNYTLQGEPAVDDSLESPLVIIGVSDRTADDPDPIIESYGLAVWKPKVFHDGATILDQILEVAPGATVDFHMEWGSTDGQSVTVVPNNVWDESGQTITVNRGDFVQLNISDTAQAGDDASVTVNATILGNQFTKEVPIIIGDTSNDGGSGAGGSGDSTGSDSSSGADVSMH